MRLISMLVAAALAATSAAYAGEPLDWVRKPNEPAHGQFDTFHGGTLDLCCTFTGFGEMPFAGSGVPAPRLYYQTNGMGRLWWSIPATVSNNALRATFTPDLDPGAPRLSMFFGSPSNTYAAAQVRFRNSPGLTPNILDPPSALDWLSELAAATNSLWGACTNDFLRKTGGSIYDLPSDSGSLDIGSPGGYSGHLRINGYAADVTIGGPNGEANLYVGGTNVMDYIAQTAGISAATATNIAKGVAAEATEGLLSDEADPHWEAEKGGYATTGAVAQASAAIGTLWSYVYGESVWFTVTNHIRTASGVAPSFQLWEVRDGATNLVYWSREEITNVTHDLIHDCKTNLEATVETATNSMPDRAWSKYQSASGAENPQPGEITIVSTPTIMLSGGWEWQRYGDVGNAVWLLESNGLTTMGGDTNEYFRITDLEGNSQFEVVKTSSYLIDAIPGSAYTEGSGAFHVTFTNHLTKLYVATNLITAAWEEVEYDGSYTTDSILGGTVAVTIEQSGEYASVTISGEGVAPLPRKMFVAGKAVQQGHTEIRNVAPVSVRGGIYCTDGVHKCRPVYNNGSISWEVVQ